MGKKSRGHRQPRQGVAREVPNLDPRAKEQAEQRQAAIHKQRIENCAAAIYAATISDAILGCVDNSAEFDEEYATDVCELSMDAALVFARTVLGIDARRQQPPQDNQPVEPIVE